MHIFRYLDALTIFKSQRRIKLMNKNLTCDRRKMEHHCLVVQTADEYLMFTSLVIETPWKLALLWATHLFSCSLLVFIFSGLHEHLQIFVKYTWSNLDVSKGLGCAFEVVHCPLAKACFHTAWNWGTSRLSRLSIHRALKPTALNTLSILISWDLLLHICVKLYNFAFVMPVFV